MSDIVSLDTAPGELVPVSFGARLSVGSLLETASAVRFCSVHNNTVSSSLRKRTVACIVPGGLRLELDSIVRSCRG